MRNIMELPIGLKGGFLDIKDVKVELNQYWVTLPIKMTDDVDYASKECYDVNYNNLSEGSTLARVETPLFRNHYVIKNIDGSVEDYSMFFDDPSKFEVIEIIPRNQLYSRTEIDSVLFGFPVTYRLYKEGKVKHLVAVSPELDGIEVIINTYYGNGAVIEEYSRHIDSEINFSPLDPSYEEIFRREKYNLEKVVEDIKSFLK